MLIYIKGKKQSNFSTGGKLRNDVWVSERMSEVHSDWDINKIHKKKTNSIDFDSVSSQMRWYQSNAGKFPPATWPSGPKYQQPMTFDDWTICQDYYKKTFINSSICDNPLPICFKNIKLPECHPEARWKKDNMWSPRRGHAAVVAEGKLYVIGGRAREFTRMDDARLIGGVQDRKIETVVHHRTIREQNILKNDVWVSEDGLGRNWKLVTPGCKDQQQDVLLKYESWSRQRDEISFPKLFGGLGSRCHATKDCYGEAKCLSLEGSSKRVCVCPLFSAREHHSVSIQHTYYSEEAGNTFAEDYFFLVGGFTSVRQSFCSNRSCGSVNSYRLAMDDAWVSNNGLKWVQFKPAFDSRLSYSGRGAHTALIIHGNSIKNETVNNENHDRLWIFGGETSSPEAADIDYLDDVWSIDLPSKPCCLLNGDCHSSQHPLTVTDIGTCLPNVFDWSNHQFPHKWSGRSGHVVLYEPPSSFNSFREQICIYGGRNEEGVLSDVWTWNLIDGEPWRVDFQPDQWYRTTQNGKVFFGTQLTNKMANLAISPYQYYLSEDANITSLFKLFLPVPSKRLSFNQNIARSAHLVKNEDVEKMRNLDIYTIHDLAFANLYTILKLRGFHYPWEESRKVNEICYLRKLAISLIEKCRIKTSVDQSEIEPHEKKYECNDGACNLDAWDGCLPLEGLKFVDVYGLGNVTVPQQTYEIIHELDEINCRQTPGRRHMAAGITLNNKMMVLGGQGRLSDELFRDVWYRDDSFPETKIVTSPETYTHDTIFSFASNEPGAFLFEYKIIDVVERRELTPWLVTTEVVGVDVSWLDNKKGGPGKGIYVLYVRAIDPSGNKEFRYSIQSNMHVWMYLPPLPWGTIFGFTILLIFIIMSLYFEYRRRAKRKALERYAIRRMRRKFKLQSKLEMGNGNWTEAYFLNDKQQKHRENKGHKICKDIVQDKKVRLTLVLVTFKLF